VKEDRWSHTLGYQGRGRRKRFCLRLIRKYKEGEPIPEVNKGVKGEEAIPEIDGGLEGEGDDTEAIPEVNKSERGRRSYL
jgi:hypothetical protein